MSASTKPKARINVRSKSFWLISIFLLYSLFGWLFVPMILDAQLKSILKSNAKWDTEIDNILFNPYALSLELSGAEIVEEGQNPVLNFDRLYVNFNLLKTLSGTISFDEITLESPEIHVDLDQQGSTNFQRAFATETPEEEKQPEESTDEAGGPIALYFNIIAISDGAVYFTDNSTGTPHTLAFEPLSLSLEAFSTHHNKGGEYALAISLSKEQSLKWQGQIGIAPFQSKGHLILSNIDSSTFWHYVKDASPYWLNQARVSIAGDYQIESLPEGLQMVINQAELVLDELVLSESETAAEWLKLKQLKVGPIRFDLQSADLDLGHIVIEAPHVQIHRAEDQTLNVLRPLADLEEASSVSSDANAAGDTSQMASESSPESAEMSITASESAQPQHSQEHNKTSQTFKWRLTDITLNQGEIHWHDQAISTPATLALNQLAVEIGAMNQDLSRAFPFDIQFAIDKSKTDATEATAELNHFKGELSPSPFSLKGVANLNELDLTLLHNYVSDTTHLAIDSGRFSLEANYDVTLDERLSGTLASSLRINQLALTDTLLNQPLSGFDALEIGPVNIGLSKEMNKPMSIQIDSIILDQLYADIFISQQGELNLAHLTKSSRSEPEAPAQSSPEPNHSDNASEDSTAMDLTLTTFNLNKARLKYTDASLSPVFTTQISELSGTIEGISSSTEAKSKVSLSGKLDELGRVAINGTVNPLSDKANSHVFIKVDNFDMTTASPYSAKFAGYQIDKGKLALDLDYLIDGSKIKARNEVILNQFEFGKSVKSEHATSLPLPLAIGILKDRKGVIDLDLPISGDLNDPSFQIGSVILNTFVNIITKVVTSPFSILGSLIEGADKLSEVSFEANASELSPEQVANIMKLSQALKERPKLSLEIRGVADANIDKLETQPRSEAELINLAKQRAQTVSQLAIEQGNIDKERVFIQEPEVVPLKETAPQPEQTVTGTNTVTTKFTLGVR